MFYYECTKRLRYSWKAVLLQPLGYSTNWMIPNLHCMLYLDVTFSQFHCDVIDSFFPYPSANNFNEYSVWFLSARVEKNISVFSLRTLWRWVHFYVEFLFTSYIATTMFFHFVRFHSIVISFLLVFNHKQSVCWLLTIFLVYCI